MKPNLSFEEALAKLEAVVKSLEVGNLPLEESMKQYLEGIELADYCSQLLKKAETLIVKMEKSGEWVDLPNQGDSSKD